MFTHKINKLPKHTIEIISTIPWSEIEKEYAKSFDMVLKDFAFEGFRKGKVPKEIAEKNIPKDTIYNHLIRALFPRVYEEAVTSNDLKPVVSPKIELTQAKENEDWEVKFTTAERPTVDIGDYKKIIQEAKKNAKNSDAKAEEKDTEKTPQTEEQANQVAFQEAMNALLKSAKIEIPEVMIEEEVNNRLTRLVDDIQRVGLTTESYLKSRNTTMDEMKQQLTQEIEDTYKMEFIMNEIADKEDIKVETEELEALFSNIKDEKQKAAIQQNAYYYASVMRKQKVLDYLNSL